MRISRSEKKTHKIEKKKVNMKEIRFNRNIM